MKNKAFLVSILAKFGPSDIITLTKIAYLADLVNYYKNKTQISSYKYVRGVYGPQSEQLEKDLFGGF